MSKPHKYAELIKAWADGADIEYRFYDCLKGWGDWKILAHDKPFLSDPWWEYRIKSYPKPDVAQPEALRLYDQLTKPTSCQFSRWDVAAELKRLHEVNAELFSAIAAILAVCESRNDSSWNVVTDCARIAIAKVTGGEA